MAHGALTGAVVACFACGTVILAWRFTGNAPGRGILSAAMTAAVALCSLAAGIVAALRRVPPRARCAAALDASARAGGLVMSAGHPGSEAWRVTPPALPRVTVRDPRMAVGLLLGAVYLAIAAALPDAFFTRRQQRVLELGTMVEEMMRQVAILEEETLVPPPVAAALSNELARVQESQEADDPGRMLEALDHLRDEIRRAANEGAQVLAKDVEETLAAASLADLLAQALSENRLAHDAPGALNDAMRELLEELAADNSLCPADDLSEFAAQQAGSLTAAEAVKMLEALSQKLSEACSNGCQQMARLCEMGMAAGQCGMSAEDAEKALAALLARDDGTGEAARNLAILCQMQMPGNGGVSRGRGDAMMTWTDPSTREAAEFKEEILTPQWLPELDESTLKGVSATAPEVSDTADPATGGFLNGGNAPHGATPSGVVLPRHRAAIRRFFERD